MRLHNRRAICILFILISVMVGTGGCGPAADPAAIDDEIASIYQAYPLLEGKEAEGTTVKRVIDGDTFETADELRVRLIGVDTPEVHGKSEPYGQEASAFSKEQLTGRKIWMFRDVSDTDRYGRLLRYVFLQGDNMMFNERLVTEGFAQPYTYPPDVLFAEQFVDAGKKARADNKGLWAVNNAGSASLAESSIPASPSCDNPQIKGNINAKGDKIYHLPDSRYYKQTIAEQMFCTEEEAIEAGFRAPKAS